MNRFVSAYRETIVAVLSDRVAMTTMILAVVLYSFFYPSAYTKQVASDFPILIVDQDHSPMSRALIRRVDAMNTVHVAGASASVLEARRLIESGKAEGVLVIADGFQRDILRGNRGNVAILGNGAFLSRASSVLQSVAEAATAFAREAAASQARFAGAPAPPPIMLVQRPLFNTREGYGSALVPGVAQLIVHQTLLMGILVMAGTRREQMRRLTFSYQGLAGIAAAFATIGLCSLTYYNGWMPWLQDYPRGGNPGGMAVAGLLYIAAVVAFALFLGSFIRTRERPFQLVTISSLPMFFLANLSWPIEATPLPLVWLAKLLPTTPGINALVQINQMGAGLDEVTPALLNLALLTLLYGGLAIWRFRPHVEHLSSPEV
ncbi:MAG: hypothetical protein JWQ61_205 [Collimonas fungivorans]|uniref:ABC transporter permease n=1 Tax=Collimonas fungivorans TaxID=158899 RepID=UPI0026EB10CC|nr:ABC transporter permease [Collimonas fungivorans]MDB5765391.1 hypothetical protein [Collimonas fungivorans]